MPPEVQPGDSLNHRSKAAKAADRDVLFRWLFIILAVALGVRAWMLFF